MKSYLLAGLAGLSMVAVAGQGGAAQAAPAAPAAPAAARLNMIPGLGILNVSEAIQASKAYAAMMQERQTVFKQQLDAAEARRLQLRAQLTPLMEKYNRDRQAGNVSQAALQAQLAAIQNLDQSGQREIQGILAPVGRAEAYVQEQFGDVIAKAITQAVTKRGISFVVPPQNAVYFNNGYVLNSAVAEELNALLPTVKLVPPANWQPRGQAQGQ